MLLEVAVTVNVWDSLAAPELILERFTVCKAAFSLILMLASPFSVGGWFTGLTVTVKERETVLLLVLPSFTVTVMVDEPNA